MRQQIKQTLSAVRRLYAAWWFLALLVVVVGELWVWPRSLCVGAAGARYACETLCIMLTMASVPLLFWYRKRQLQQIDREHTDVALRHYRALSRRQLLLLSLPLVFGIVLYYLFHSNTGALCALIALAASLFCFPFRQKIYRELRLDDVE